MLKKRVWSTPLIVLGLVLYYVHMITAYGQMSFDSHTLYQAGGILGHVFTWQDWPRLLSASIVHSDLQHLINNVLVLLIVGHQIEPILGTVRFSFVYLLTAIYANLCVVYFSPDVVTVGASGAIFGLFGFVTVGLLFKHSPLHIAFQQYAVLIGINLLSTFLVPNVSIAAHIGGFVGGLILGIIYFIIDKVANHH